MSVLDNPRHERFAQLLAKGTPMSKAYLEAGYETTTVTATSVNAANLARNEAVDARYRELCERGAEKAAVSRSRIQEELLRSIGDAREVRQHSVAVRALELLGKDIGMFVERKEIKTSKLDEMSIEELNDLISTLSEPGDDKGAASGESGEAEKRTEDRDLLP